MPGMPGRCRHAGGGGGGVVGQLGGEGDVLGQLRGGVKMSSLTATSCEEAAATWRSLTHLYQGILEIGPRLIQ